MNSNQLPFVPQALPNHFSVDHNQWKAMEQRLQAIQEEQSRILRESKSNTNRVAASKHGLQSLVVTPKEGMLIMETLYRTVKGDPEDTFTVEVQRLMNEGKKKNRKQQMEELESYVSHETSV